MTIIDKFAILFSIIGLPIAILLWFLKDPSTIQGWYQRNFSKINIDGLLGLESLGLKIINKEIIRNTKVLNKHREIYWPVVPTDSPNLIHAAFIVYLKELTAVGLKVNLFVFDYYYASIHKREFSSVKIEIDQFIRSLNLMGLSNINHKVYYESNIISNKNSCNQISLKLLEYFGKVSKKDIDSISSYKTYTDNETETTFIRYIKPFFNMIYLASISNAHGFTLSGYDEKSLWDAYHKYIGKYSDFAISNLYIPTMGGIDPFGTNILDKINNISFCDSIKDISEKILHNTNVTNENCCINYAFKYIVFPKLGSIKLINSENYQIIYPSYDLFMKEVLSKRIDLLKTSHELAKYIYDIFHG